MRIPPLGAAAAASLLTGCGLIPGSAAHTERQAREVLAASLFDSESARLQNVRSLVDRTHGDPPIAIICGEVNAKNKMGAYVGFRKFIVVPKEAFSAIDPDASDQASDDDAASQEVFNDAYNACGSATAS